MTRTSILALVLLVGGASAQANPPVASYIFPAGGQRGTKVPFRVGGLYLHQRCSFEMCGVGVKAPRELRRTQTLWLEGPFLPMPASQKPENYPKDMAGTVEIARDAPVGVRYWQVWTSQGATAAKPFMVGDLPESIEEEIAGKPVPVKVPLPRTINGRIFPREDVDIWAFSASRGQSITCAVHANRLGSPLDARLEVRTPSGRRLTENDDRRGTDPVVRFTAPTTGIYHVHIHDIAFNGGQAFVYRLTLTAGPRVERVYPLGGRKGTQFPLELTGQGLPTTPIEVALPATAKKTHRQRLRVQGQWTNTFLLDVGDLPEHLEKEANDDPKRGVRVQVPATLNGRIHKPGDVDHWILSLGKGERIECDLRAGRLGSPLEGELAMLDGKGKQLARVGNPGVDPLLRFTAPAAGDYLLRVAGQFRSQGGPEYAYRIRVAPPDQPDFTLRLERDVLVVPRGGKAKMKVFVDRQGFREAIDLRVEGLPEGVKVTGTTLAKNKKVTTLLFETGEKQRIEVQRLRILGTAGVGERTVTRRARLPVARGMPAIDTVLLSIAVPTPFKFVGDYRIRLVPRGTIYRRHYKLERGGFKGPLRVTLADGQIRHLQGVTGPTITIPAGKNEFDYPVTFPSWMEMGRTCRVTLMVAGVVEDPDGRKHVVSYTSRTANDQIITIMEPGPLSLAADRTSLTVIPGKQMQVPLRIQRGKGVTGNVKLELIVPEHIQGISTPGAKVDMGKTKANLPVTFAAKVRGPFNAPLIIRATAQSKAGPVTAETRVALRGPD